ncbi:MAG: OmpA family protein [Bacteroides sp.]|nr:OmpA family protein [Bacteroides sp.]
MKKTILLSAFVLGALSLQAQNALQGTKLCDNWSIGLITGSTAKITHSNFTKSMRPGMGLEINKQLTPIFGIGIQGLSYVNTTNSKTAIDATDVSMLGRINLMNLFAGYEGMPRYFEIETQMGLGWLHYFQAGAGDSNSLSGRMGLNLNLNLGESKAWTISMRPGIVYDLQADYPKSKLNFNLNNARFEWMTSIIYHFGNSNGEHYMTLVPVCDPLEMAAINDEVNALRATLLERDAELVAATEEIANLQNAMNTPNEVVEIDVNETCTPVYTIGFRQGKAIIDMTQEANIEMAANFLKENNNVIVSIKGYASPEGNAEFNQELSTRRANAVKEILVSQYGIDASRIITQGEGVGNIFSEPAWNRISILTVESME